MYNYSDNILFHQNLFNLYFFTPHVFTCTCRSDTNQIIEEVNFRQFVRTLARFRKISHSHEHETCTEDKKIECK